MKSKQGMHPNSRNGFNKNPLKGQENRNWRGQNASYPAFHSWMLINFGKASSCESENCSRKSKTYDWALIHGKNYDHKRENFMMLCRSCHVKYDMTEERKIKISNSLINLRVNFAGGAIA